MAGQVTVIKDVPYFAGVSVMLPLLIDAVATDVVALVMVGVAPLEQVAVNVLLVPYVPLTLVVVELVTVDEPSFTVVVLFAFVIVQEYSPDIVV